MPLSAQEQRCIDSARACLGELYGGVWQVADGPTLDDLHTSRASPECIVTNGSVAAAIEVKRLTGDSVYQAYSEALRSLSRSLAPSCGGYYLLGPAVDFRLPIDGALRRVLKKEIERVARTLVPGGEPGAVLIPRKAFVAMSRADGPGYLWCSHNSSGGLVVSASHLVTGTYMLVDQDMLEHEFVTEEGKRAFHDSLADGCRSLAAGGSGDVEWFEEWKLWRAQDFPDDDPRDRDAVHVISVTEAREVSSSVAEALDIVLEKALRKFARRWADKHVIVLDRATVLCSAERVIEALSWAAPDELANVDLILLTDDEDVSIVWQREAESL